MSEYNREWLYLDELENAIDNLEMVPHFLEEINSTMKWKWAIIALHQALYGFAVCAANCPPDYQVIKFSQRAPDGKLISIWSALKIAGEPLPKSAPNDFFKPLNLSTEEDEAIKLLVDGFRNEFEHFKPKSWSISISSFPSMILKVLGVIKFLALESNRVNNSSKDSLRIERAIEKSEELIAKIMTASK